MVEEGLFSSTTTTTKKKTPGRTLLSFSSSSSAEEGGAVVADAAAAVAAVAVEELKFEDDYLLKEKLAKGSFGTVYVTQHVDSGEEFAVKVIHRKSLSKKDGTTVNREVSILRDCVDVDGIVRLVDFYSSPSQMHVVLVYAQGGDLFERLASRTSYNEKDARDLAIHLLKTMDVLHSRKIVHRDLKPENLLLRTILNDSDVLVADFGFAAHVPETGLTTRCGTPAFVAPEVIVQNCRYYEQIDMWSVGCLLFMLLGGYPPFQDKTHRGLFRKIRGADFCFHEAYWKNVSVSAKQLIASLLTVNPEFRCTARMALEKSNWLKLRDRTLQDHDLSTSLTEFKKFQARQTLKGAMHAVLWSVKVKFKSVDDIGFSKQMFEWDKDDEAKQRVDNAIECGAMTDSESRPTLTFSDVYERKDQIHTGRGVTVYECLHRKRQEMYAVKIIDKLSGMKESKSTGMSLSESVLHELAVLQTLKHKYVIHIIDFFEDDGSFYLIMEQMKGGDVFDRIIQKKKYTEKDARDFANVLLEGLAYIHEKGVAHRDLKPQNLLLKSKDDHADIKIADFSFACRVHTPQSLTTRCGTPTFVAPEILKNIPYDQSADMWSVGVILYILLCGYPPFQDEDQRKLFQCVRQGDWSFHGPEWKNVSNDAKDLIRHLLVVDPVSRWTAKHALEESVWLKKDHDKDEALEGTDLSYIPEEMKKRRSRLKTVAKTIMWMNRANKSKLEYTDSKDAVEQVLARPETTAEEEEVDTNENENGDGGATAATTETQAAAVATAAATAAM